MEQKKNVSSTSTYNAADRFDKHSTQLKRHWERERGKRVIEWERANCTRPVPLDEWASCSRGKSKRTALRLRASRQASILAHTHTHTEVTHTHTVRHTGRQIRWQLNCILICWIWRAADSRHSRAGQQMERGKGREGSSRYSLHAARCKHTHTHT